MANELMRWDPFEDLRILRQAMNRGHWPTVQRQDVEFGAMDEALPVDIYEKDQKLVVKAAVAGVKPEDVEVNVTDGILHIRTESKQEDDVNEGDYHRREYRLGRCSRSFRLPPNIDATKAVAKFENGMLKIEFPKAAQQNTRTIKLEVQK